MLRGYGGIGRRARLRIWCLHVQVRLLLPAPLAVLIEGCFFRCGATESNSVNCFAIPASLAARKHSRLTRVASHTSDTPCPTRALRQKQLSTVFDSFTCYPHQKVVSEMIRLFYPSRRLGISSAFYEYVSQKASISSATLGLDIIPKGYFCDLIIYIISFR